MAFSENQKLQSWCSETMAPTVMLLTTLLFSRYTRLRFFLKLNTVVAARRSALGRQLLW